MYTHSDHSFHLFQEQYPEANLETFVHRFKGVFLSPSDMQNAVLDEFYSEYLKNVYISADLESGLMECKVFVDQLTTQALFAFIRDDMDHYHLFLQ